MFAFSFLSLPFACPLAFFVLQCVLCCANLQALLIYPPNLPIKKIVNTTRSHLEYALSHKDFFSNIHINCVKNNSSALMKTFQKNAHYKRDVGKIYYKKNYFNSKYN